GQDETRGALEVRFVEHADSLIERLASENRSRERVCVVSSDATVRATAGRLVQTRTSQAFLGDVAPIQHAEGKRSALEDRLDPDTRAALERLRRGQSGSGRTYVPIIKGPSQTACKSVDPVLSSASS